MGARGANGKELRAAACEEHGFLSDLPD